MEIVTYKKFKTKADAFELIELLNANGIEYYIEDIRPSYDMTFAGGAELDDKFVLKLKSTDFEKVDKMLNAIAAENIDLVVKDYYLFDFSDDELYGILEKFDEWSITDVMLAQKILNERGKNVSNESVQEIKDKRIDALKEPEKGHKGWLMFGFVSAIFGGLIGILIGYHYFRSKKTIPTGDKVFAYDAETRKIGLIIFCLSFVALFIWILIGMLD